MNDEPKSLVLLVLLTTENDFKKVWTHLIFIFQRANPKGKSG